MEDGSDDCHTQFFMKPVKYSHFFESLIYPFVQVEINNINPHYVGCYTHINTNLHADFMLCASILSQILRRHTNVYVILKTFQFYVFNSSILSRFEINLLNYLFMRSTTIWCCCCCCSTKKTSMMRAKNVVRTSHLLALACACVFSLFCSFYLFDK